VSDKRISVRIWQPISAPSPGNTWRIDFNDGHNHILVDGPTEDSTQAKFCLDYSIARENVIWLKEPPPPPRQPGRPSTVNAPSIEGETDATKFHRAPVRRFHSDLVGDRTFTADDVLAIVNEAWRASAK
jgi:hypothetical protein